MDFTTPVSSMLLPPLLSDSTVTVASSGLPAGLGTQGAFHNQLMQTATSDSDVSSEPNGTITRGSLPRSPRKTRHSKQLVTKLRCALEQCMVYLKSTCECQEQGEEQRTEGATGGVAATSPGKNNNNNKKHLNLHNLMY